MIAYYGMPKKIMGPSYGDAPFSSPQSYSSEAEEEAACAEAKVSAEFAADPNWELIRR
jgi:hypothetical protein